MKTILHIKSSSNLNGSVSRKIGALAVKGLKETHPDSRTIERDLVASNIPHLSPEFLGAMFSGKDDDSSLALSRQLIDELSASDIIVLEAPMYNFSIPSVLKAWIDHVVRAGKTFQYGATGAQGMLTGKRAILVLGRGGVYSEGPYKVMDYQETYLRAILGFMGITEVESIYIEGVAMGPETITKALATATERAYSVTRQAT